MNVEEQVFKTVSKSLGVGETELNRNSHLMDDLNSDPLALADLVVSLEDEFKISIAPEDSHKFVTVGDLVDYVSEAIGEV